MSWKNTKNKLTSGYNEIGNDSSQLDDMKDELQDSLIKKVMLDY